MLTKLEKQYGLKLANGQDTLKGKILRLAHMGYIDQFDILAAIAGVDAVLSGPRWRTPGVSPGSDRRQRQEKHPRAYAAGFAIGDPYAP